MRELTTSEKKRKKKYPDTEVFHWFNANPKGKITTDCVIRALSVGLQKDYYEVIDELIALQKKTGLMINDKALYTKYLKQLGYEKQKQPRKSDNTKYTGAEFAKIINGNCIAHIGGHHLVAIIDHKIIDIWNSSHKCIGNYWQIKN